MKYASLASASRRAMIVLVPAALAACIVAPAPHRGPPPVEVVDVPRPPPPPRVEAVPPPPGPSYFWVAGHWRWERGEHVWLPGHWETVRAGYHWVPAHWVAVGPSWRLVPGQWRPN